ncbi:MAG TPA: protein kinase [Thermoanaerobaculia bacterium]|nr:protein kinase [Thermoanaerobaculia bacterium]
MASGPLTQADQPTLRFGDGDPTAPIEASRTFIDGEVLASRYRIVRFIAAGGMGEVYEAFDLDLHEPIAIKSVRAEAATQDSIERLKREIQLARKVTHPNVCRIYDLAHHRRESGHIDLFVTMELLRGKTLAQHIRDKKRLTTSEALPIVKQICDGLAAAHRAGIIHRDLKCENVILDGDGERAVITDFGLAHGTVANQDAFVTHPNMIMGSAAYLAPEQCQGAQVTPAADIYALGVVMFEMITGRRPFPDEPALATVVRKIKEAPSSPRSIVPQLEVRWEATILRCLERDPNDRFRTATEVVDALTGASPIPRLRHHRRNMKWIAAIVAIAIVAAIAGAFLQRRFKPPERRRPAVAVIGFRNIAGHRDAEWLSPALAEMLTTELAAEGRLRAIPGEDVQRARIELKLGSGDSFSKETLARIHDNLGADLVVAGSFVDVGDQLRVDVRVQDTSNARDTSIAETGTTAHLFDLVSRVGARMREELGVASVASQSSSQALGALPSDPNVARFYAMGLAQLRGFDALSARDSLERAVDAAPDQPLPHAALASAWSALGYDRNARDEAKRAFDLSSKLTREQRLVIEAGYRETIGDWTRAAEIDRALATLFPDDLDYQLRLANAQTKKGTPADALTTIASMHKLAADPRIDIAEMDAAGSLSDYARMQAAATRAIALGEQRATKLLTARAMSGLGVSLHRQGRTTEAIDAQQKALALYREAGDIGGAARCLLRIGSVYIYLGDVPRARPFFVEALAAGERNGDAWLKSAGSNNLAFCAFMAGKPSEAEALLAKMLELAKEIGDPKLDAIARDNIAYAHFLRGDLAGAEKEIARCIDVAQSVHAQQVLAVGMWNAADFKLARGDVDGAKRQHEAALAIREKIGEKRAIAESRISLANVAIEQRRVADAEKLARDAAGWAKGAKVWDVEANARIALSRVLPKDAALRELDAASQLSASHFNVIVKINVLIARARLLRSKELAEEAVRLSSGELVEPRARAERLMRELR